MLNLKSPKTEAGFSLPEVLVAILIATTFAGIAMQAVALGAYFKVRARQFSEATTWIQQDFESVKNQASQLSANTTKCKSNTQDAGYGKYLEQNLPTLSGGGTKIITGKSYTLQRTTSIGGNTAISGTCPTTYHACYEVLRLTYTVNPTSGGSPTATIYSEVLPDAVFQCP